jgi:diaminohydroxyphosphoribosylaminopyrimidine deaminase/5-amino-6-(5-phosphoribosylamino)uracil reductase
VDKPPVSTVAADTAFMRRALALAERGLYSTQPNPFVGAVIVRGDAIIAEGHTQPAGRAHAEADALNDASARNVDVRGATLYVNLEPCNRHGRTPPCTEAIIAAGIGRVVYAIDDPNPAMHGGAARLAAAGITVDSSVEAAAAQELNIGFLSRITRGRPWVRSKIAASLDGRTALVNGRSRWLTGAGARADGHHWRARAGAILTGVGTVLQDDPQLTVRAVDTPRQPLRVVVDRRGDTPASARVLADGHALIVTADVPADRSWPAGVEVLDLPDGQGRVDLKALLAELAAREIGELHVEAGARLNGALLEAGLIDEWLIYLAPMIIGDPARGMADRRFALNDVTGRADLEFRSVDRVGDDVRIIARQRHAG